MKRYNLCSFEEILIPEGHGQWVQYREAQIEIERLQGELEEAKETICELTRELEFGEE